MGDETPGALRDAPPDILGPIDESAPVSGHVVAPEAPRPSVTEARSTTGRLPHESSSRLSGRPGTHGLTVADLTQEALQADSTRHHSQPLVDEGPCGIPSSTPSTPAAST